MSSIILQIMLANLVLEIMSKTQLMINCVQLKQIAHFMSVITFKLMIAVFVLIITSEIQLIIHHVL